MKLLFPQTAAEWEPFVGRPEEDDSPVYPLGDPPAPVLRVLADLAARGDVDRVIVLRDWERCIFAIVEGCDLFDVLAITETGRVGRGGVNMPRYYDTVAEVAEAMLRWQLEHAKVVRS